MPPIPRIALLVGSYRRYRRHVLYGIARYAQEHGPWQFAHQDEPIKESLPQWLTGESWDAAVVRIDGEPLCEPFRRLDIPLVDVAGLKVYDGIKAVSFNGKACGAAAAEHLIECGLDHFAFYGVPDILYSIDALRGYSEQIGKAGRNVHSYLCQWSAERIYASFRETLGLRSDVQLVDWIASLPKPVGVFACNDFRAYEVLEACRSLKLPVPEEVAVVGLGNDEVLCELNPIPLTSVDPNSQRIGYDAAAWIGEVLDDRKTASLTPTWIEPLGVVARRSTDILFLEDDAVARAVRFIRNRVHAPLRVEDVYSHVGLSRRTLERRFAAQLGHTPNEEIARARLKRLTRLLLTTDLSVAEIAARIGFDHPESVFRFFKTRTGQSIGDFRTQHRALAVSSHGIPTSFSVLAPSKEPGVGGPDGLDGIAAGEK